MSGLSLIFPAQSPLRSFDNGGVELLEGTQISLSVEGDVSTRLINVDYPNLLQDVQLGDSLSFADGNVVVRVEDREGDRLKARVVHGGRLEGRPGLHVPSDRLRLTRPQTKT